MDALKVIVQFGTHLIDIGCCDIDHISLISLVHETCERHTGKSKVPVEKYDVRVFLPWCDEVVEVHTDVELIQVFKKFQEKGLDEIVVQVEQKPDFLQPPEGSSCVPNAHLEVLEDNYQPIRWNESEEMSNYESDNEEVGGVVVGGEDVVVGAYAIGGEVVVGDDDIFNECMRLFEGYQSKSDDEFESDSDREQPEAKVVRLIKGTYFQLMVGGGIQFHVGQTHDSMDKLRGTLRDYAIQEGVELDRIKNQKCRLTYRCKAKGCPWRIHASCMIDKVTVMIKTYNDQHECHRVYNNVEAKVKWISSKFETLVKNNPDISVKVIADLLREKYMVSVDMQRLYKAKKRALKGLAADHANCFQLLRRYAHIVNQLNPGLAIYISLQQPLPTFHRLFLSFEAQKLGFLEGCRPFIGLDGCHLKGPFGGVLLSTVALDANSGLYPLAVCICEKETNYSWSWFLNHLKEYLQYPEGRPLTFMTDRQKGVINALEDHFPFAKRRYCARHIYANFRQKHPGDNLKKLFWKASRSCNIYEYKNVMEAIGVVKEDAKLWLQKIEPKHWSRFSFDQSIRCDHVTNNMTESFNSMLGNHRAATYLELLEYIRRLVMGKFQQRKVECEKWNSVIPPRINSKILKASRESRLLKIINAGEMEYELMGLDMTCAVKLREYTCACGRWQISGIPCCHAMAAISHYCGRDAVKDKVVEFVHQSLTKSAYMHTYRSMIHPLPDQNMWPDVEAHQIIPPPLHVQPGRPKLQRKREPDERPKEGRTGSVVCKSCNKIGHNKRTCINGKSVRKKRKSKNSDASSSQPHSTIGTSSSQSRTQTQPDSQTTQHMD